MSRPKDSSQSHHQVSEEYFLWQQFKQGDRQAFAQLYQSFNSPLFKYGMTLIRDRDRVKDALQELFVELWNRKANLGNVQSVRFYLLISLRRLLFKKTASSPEVFGLSYFDDDSELFSSGTTPELDYIQQQTHTIRNEQMWREIEKLPRRQKEAIYLRFYQGLSYEEVTAIMAVDYQVVRNLIYKAIKNLRAKLASNLEFFFLIGIMGWLSSSLL